MSLRNPLQFKLGIFHLFPDFICVNSRNQSLNVYCIKCELRNKSDTITIVKLLEIFDESSSNLKKIRRDKKIGYEKKNKLELPRFHEVCIK